MYKKEGPSVNNEACRVKKQNKPLFGFKQTITVDEKGMIDAVSTTSANVNDSKTQAVLLSFLP